MFRKYNFYKKPTFSGRVRPLSGRVRPLSGRVRPLSGRVRPLSGRVLEESLYLNIYPITTILASIGAFLFKSPLPLNTSKADGLIIGSVATLEFVKMFISPSYKVKGPLIMTKADLHYALKYNLNGNDFYHVFTSKQQNYLYLQHKINAHLINPDYNIVGQSKAQFLLGPRMMYPKGAVDAEYSKLVADYTIQHQDIILPLTQFYLEQGMAITDAFSKAVLIAQS